MKRVEKQAERARRYSEALVAASLNVRAAVASPGVVGRRPKLPGWWEAQLSPSTPALPELRRRARRAAAQAGR